MIGLDVREARVFVRPGCTDMRKQINGLALIVEQVMQADVFQPALFLFCNGEWRILKALYWDRTGFCLWQLCEGSHNQPLCEVERYAKKGGDQPQSGANPALRDVRTSHNTQEQSP